MRNDDRVRLQHMIEAGESAIDFVSGRVRADLDGDRMLLFALVRALEIVGEAAHKISDETRATLPAIPWPAIVGMRNRLIHAYFEVDPQLVWQTATVELPALLPKLRKLVGSK